MGDKVFQKKIFHFKHSLGRRLGTPNLLLRPTQTGLKAKVDNEDVVAWRRSTGGDGRHGD